MKSGKNHPTSERLPILALIGLLVFCFGLAAPLDTWFQNWRGNRLHSGNPLTVVLGESSRMFANHFFVKADAYFHSGFYPTIFDNREAFQTPHMAEDAGAVRGNNHGDEAGFLDKPHDWIDAFSRQFFPSRHTHLDEGGAKGRTASADNLGGSSEVREILPWLQLSAELDPNNVRSFTVGAYWLRERMGKPDEAERFLRKGLRENPGSFEILYELGRVFDENHHDTARARNLWELALRHWQQVEPAKKDPDDFMFLEIVSHLAKLEEKAGNYRQALAYLDLWKTRSPYPGQIEQQAADLRKKIAAAPGPGAAPAKPSVTMVR
jgi:tetratricopeptide (TPR) repeat protein